LYVAAAYVALLACFAVGSVIAPERPMVVPASLKVRCNRPAPVPDPYAFAKPWPC
jgi:hypothetical protein